jgi:hypothetical protein
MHLSLLHMHVRRLVVPMVVLAFLKPNPLLLLVTS